MVINDDQYDQSKLAFAITVSLELYPGANITKEQIDSVKCNSRWESVRQAWAEFTGKPYMITPNYKQIQSSQNKTQNNRSLYQNYNQRFGNQPKYTRRSRQYNGPQYNGGENNNKNKTLNNKIYQIKKLNKTRKL